jgi:hypothetical protein
MADMDKVDKAKKAMAIMKVLQGMDKSMFSSKKFMGLMFFEVSWKLLIAYGIYVGLDSNVLLAMVAAAGSVEGVGNWVQGSHDKAVKTAKLKALNGSGSTEIEEPSTDLGASTR